MGPAVTSTRRNFNWLYSALADDRSELGVLTGHRYSLNACSKPTAPGYPTIARTLDESSPVGMARSVSNAVGLAHHRKRPFRLDELNSVTCGGLAGVSDTFATALWAPDALFALLSTGLDGLNLHIRPDKINSPFRLTSRGLEARPLLMGSSSSLAPSDTADGSSNYTGTPPAPQASKPGPSRLLRTSSTCCSSTRAPNP